MNEANLLSIQLVSHDGNRVEIAGVELDIRFYVQGRIRYTFLLGRTDDKGTVCTHLSDIEQQLQENRRIFLMDYNTGLDECDSVVGIFVPSPEEIARRDTARQTWWPGTTATPETSNSQVHCPEQKFQLSRTAPNEFELACGP